MEEKMARKIENETGIMDATDAVADAVRDWHEDHGMEEVIDWDNQETWNEIFDIALEYAADYE